MKYQILFKRMLGVGLMLALLTGCTASAMPAPTPMPPTSTSIPPGLAPTPTTNILIQTLMIGDYQYVMECNGEGSPAVLLFGGRAANWKPILTEIKVSTRTCL